MSRPTKYKPEYAQQLLDYFGETEEAYRQVEDNQGRIQLVGCRLPTFQRFAFQAGVSVQTLHNWKAEHDEFFEAYTRAKTYQTALMLEGGMVGALNPSFTGLAMKNLHDWKDKLETENTHTGQIDLNAIESNLETARAKREEWQEEANKRIERYST